MTDNNDQAAVGAVVVAEEVEATTPAAGDSVGIHAAEAVEETPAAVAPVEEAAEVVAEEVATAAEVAETTEAAA